VIVASGIAMQFGAKPLFENVTVKLGGTGLEAARAPRAGRHLYVTIGGETLSGEVERLVIA
jgi:hypothetical protein